MHVVCLRCGLIVDRKRKNTDLRTLTELFERVQCGNCCARSVLGEVIFSFDGGVSFYERPEAPSIPADVESIVLAQPEPNWPPWKPVRYAWSAAPLAEPLQEQLTVDANLSPAGQSFFDRHIDWKEAALTAAGFAVLGGVGVLVLQGLRMLIYIFAVAFDG